MNRNVPLTAKVGLTPSPLLPGSSSLSRTGWTLARRSDIRPAGTQAREAKPKSAATGKGGMGQPKATPAGKFSAATKLLVRKRAGCGDEFQALAECCGAWLGRHAGEFQHRASRGSGGCRDAVINGPANCALMCPDCHRRAEARDPDMGSDPHLAGDAAGFWIGHGTTPEYDPRNVPIRLHSAGGGITVYLAADGLGDDGTGYLHQRPEVAAA